MAHQNTSFPVLKLVHGFSIETETPTTVVSNFAKEYRIRRYEQEKRTFVYQSRNITYADWLVIKNFFDSVGWLRDSFNFTIPGTTDVVSVRLNSTPTISFVSVDKDNVPVIIQMTDIVLKQVFNE